MRVPIVALNVLPLSSSLMSMVLAGALVCGATVGVGKGSGGSVLIGLTTVVVGKGWGVGVAGVAHAASKSVATITSVKTLVIFIVI